MRTLDLWLEHIDTDTRLPLFESQAEEYTVPSLGDVDWGSEPDIIVQVARRQNLTAFTTLTAPEQFKEVFAWLLERGQPHLLLKSFDYLLAAMKNRALDKVSPGSLLPIMGDFLGAAPFLAISFGRMEPFVPIDEYLDNLQTLIENRAFEILRAYVLSANEAQELVIAPLLSFLSRVRGLSLQDFADLIELVALTVRQPDLALDILRECFERESTRLLPGRPALVRHFVRNTIAIALDHIGEAFKEAKKRKDLLKLKLLPKDRDGYQVVEIVFRIDSEGGTPETSAHVRLTAATSPANSLLAAPYSIDALAIHSEQGRARFQCFHPLPPFYDRCPWKLEYCGPFTTVKTMFDAVCNFSTRFEDCCRVANQILLGDVPGTLSGLEINARRVVSQYPQKEKLNASQNAAVQAALDSPLTCLWGPPGTGKTETIVEIIRALQICFDKPRILVTAPTHNAVDNVMRRYLGRLDPTVLANNPHLAPLRVSTEVRKVAEDLRKYTCDAMVGQEIHANRKALDLAKKQVRDCRIIFTTCIGAGLGLLRSKFDDSEESTKDPGKMNLFDMVIVDEASQQTEPTSLVPLVKGCEKAILVGDHVQLRPTVQQHSAAMEFDKSLFERLFTQPEPNNPTNRPSSPLAPPPFLSRLMLDTQYRMHPSISAFPSAQFYASKLLTGIPPTSRPLFASAFPWPRSPTGGNDPARTVFIDCPAREDLGSGKSKTNAGQADLALRVCQLLCTPSPTPPPGSSNPTPSSSSPTTKPTTPNPNPNPPSNAPKTPSHSTPHPQSIAILTPYAKQAALLKRLLSPLSSSSNIEVSSIDGFQGREADVVVLVTVRCNERGEIGFFKDERRVNVALTRARAGLVVVGSRGTLTGPVVGRRVEGLGEGVGREEGEGEDGKRLWRLLVGGLVSVELGEEGVGAG